jgi:hypothetical protein
MNREETLPLEPDEAARNAHIAVLTGVEVDPRSDRHNGVPLEDMKQMVIGVQVGDKEAMQALIATRLAWAHDSYAQKEVVRQRSDLEIGDILLACALATIKVAQRPTLDINNPRLGPDLRSNISCLMDEILIEGKLLPSVSNSNSRVVRGSNGGRNRERIADRMIPVGDGADVLKLAAEADSTAQADPENTVFTSERRRVLARAISGLSYRKRLCLEVWLGNNDNTLQGPMTFAGAGRQLGITRARAHQLKDKAIEDLAATLSGPQLKYLLGYGDLDLESPRWTPEEIEAKRAAENAEQTPTPGQTERLDAQ